MKNPDDDTLPVAMAVSVPAVPIPPPTHDHRQEQQFGQPPTYPTQATAIDENQVARLMEQGYTRGLIESLEDTKKEFALRIWIVDNSGSMQHADGHKMVETKHAHQLKMVECSRWEEIQSCVNYHIQLADAIQSPTSFRLMNHPGASVGPQRFDISGNNENELTIAKKTIAKARPGGCTPLTNHIMQIHQEVLQMAPMLNATGQKVAIILATDGLPTDERGYGGYELQKQFMEKLRLLEGLPVWIVIRLCTDEEEVVKFYNELDDNLELSFEVLDDYVGEEQEVYKENPWLNYSLILHRMREMGYHRRVFDLLDERKLTKAELRDFCVDLFGDDSIEDPSVDWQAFAKHVGRLNGHKNHQQWNPIKQKVGPWIDVHELNNIYGEPGCVIS